MKDLQEHVDPARAFLTRADQYVGTSGSEGTAPAMENVESAIEKAASPGTKIIRRTNMEHPDPSGENDLGAGMAAMHSTGTDPGRLVTTLDMPGGTRAIHTASRKRRDGWIVVVDLRIAPQDHCRIQIMTGMLADPVGILPDHSSDENARAAVMLALSCARTHLLAASDAPREFTPDQEEACFREADLAVARAEATTRTVLYVQHATPWSPARVVDRAGEIDLMVDATVEGMAMPCATTRLRVSVDATGGAVVIHARGTLTHVPDPLTRLRILTSALKAAS